MRTFIPICFIVVITVSLLTPTPILTSILTPTPVSQNLGKTIFVTDTADSGFGTLRQALLDAQSGDTITFDPAVFLPNAPVTIYLTSSLPPIPQGNLTIDASNAGVVLDGSNISEDWALGLEISSDGNTIQGLQIVKYPGAGIVLSGGAQNNTIGGDRSIGSGPLGQGNLVGNGDIGIGLWDVGTSFNTITGNLIGTDATGTEAWSNDGSGIWIAEGASQNIIGPNNIIAYNNAHGIEILGSDTFGNTVVKNSIHDNGEKGIYLWEGGNAELSAPFITDFNLDAGTLMGTACANCTVEIFSDSSNEGEIYEGRTTADRLGVFTFNKGTSFTGPHLTATATDADGNTSEFSVPTSGTSRSTILQEGNNLPKTQLQPKQSRELEDNRIGQMNSLEADIHTEQDVDGFVDQNSNMGYKWIRLTIDLFDWNEVESTGTYSEYSIDPNHDRAITGLIDNGIKIMYCLVFWDEATQVEEGYSRFKTEDEIQRYLNYVKFIVHNFKDRIEYYEILNEPNIGEGTQQYVELADYINLVKRTVPIIRQEYPEARIVAGAITPLYCIEDIIRIEPGAHEYLFGILESDVMPLVDAVSWHAIGGASPEYGEEYYYDYPSIVQEIKSVASAHGFQGEYIAEELHWRTPKSPHPHEYDEYGETAAAKYLARGIVMHLGMDVTVGLADPLEVPPKMRVVQNIGIVMAGAEAISLPIEIQSDATNIRNYSFSLPNGDKLIALWTDGVAVDEDPGVEANLTFQGFAAQDVMGIDVLEGFQQPIITSNENGNLAVQNLIVRDYPLILRLTPSPEVTPSISISLSANTVNRGESVTVSGLISSPISGAMVHLTYWTAGEAEVERTVTAALDGSFSDTYMPDAAGSWSVEASWEGDVKYASATSQTLEFTVAEPPTTGSLKIIVQDENENPTSGATVSSTSQPSGQQTLSGSSGTDGSVLFSEVKSGSYTFQASKSEYITKSKLVNAKAGETAALIITLEKEAPPTEEKKVCIIATATYGSELAPEVQFLRGFRDNTVLNTFAGKNFMTVFNAWYYSFSPTMAAVIVGNNILRGFMKIILYPLIGILNLAATTHSLFSFNPELAVVVSGIIASSLLGIIYFAPIVLILCLIKKVKIPTKAPQVQSLIWVISVGCLTIAEIIQWSGLMMISTAMFVLCTMSLAILSSVRYVNRFIYA